MAVRSDFTIDWDSSPRVIIIDSPSVECTMQDLLDTLRWEESQSLAMANASLVSASGKEPLGGGTLVGITVSLQNAQIGFEARSGPDWVICDLSGGNLVSFDTDGSTVIVPLYPTAYVSIAKTSSSSATLQEQDALNYSSYGGMVSVDIDSSNIGTVYPVGNQEYPVNNFSDAQTIANEKGFHELGIRKTCILDSGTDFTGFKIHGVSHVATIVTVSASCSLDKVVFSDMEVIGSLDSNTDIGNCIVRDLIYFNGHIHDSAIGGTITLDGATDSLISNCTRFEETTIPEIDFNNGDNHLVMPNFTGLVNLINMTDSGATALISINGRITLDSASCTNGFLNVIGVGYLQDELGNAIPTGTWNGMSIINKLISNASIADAVWEYER